MARRGGLDLAQGGGFAEPWVRRVRAICPVGAIDSARDSGRCKIPPLPPDSHKLSARIVKSERSKQIFRPLETSWLTQARSLLSPLLPDKLLNHENVFTIEITVFIYVVINLRD